MDLFRSPYIIVPFVAWLSSQLIKFGIKAMRGDMSFRYFYKSGEMPSSHTAIVMALLVVLGFLNGVDSAIFGVASVFSLIVIYDAVNVRRAVGEQGGVLARLIELSRTPKHEREKIKVREVLGHTPLEVFAGGSLGLVISFLLMYSHWSSRWQSFATTFTKSEEKFYLILWLLLIIAGIIVSRLFARKKYRKLPTARRIIRYMRAGVIAPSIIGVLALWLHQQGVKFFGTKIWTWIAVFWVSTGLVLGYLRVFRLAREALKEESSHFSRIKARLHKRSKSKRRRKK